MPNRHKRRKFYAEIFKSVHADPKLVTTCTTTPYTDYSLEVVK